jgi:hypothetical protein
MEKLNPNYVIGFVDGEECFEVSISKHNTTKLRRDAQLSFELEQIRQFVNKRRPFGS